MQTAPVNNLRGIGFLVAAGIFLMTNDAISKWLVPHYPPGQIICISGALIGLLSACLMKIKGESALAAPDWRPHLYRGGFYVIGAFAFILALGYLPFAQVVAIAFVGPMFMILFGSLFLNEVVGWQRFIAVLVGFVGVLLVIQPGTDAMHWAVILPIIVALADAARDLVTRKMVAGESNLRIVFSTGVMLCVIGSLTAFGDWQPIRTQDMMWFLFGGFAFVVAHYLMVEAFRHGQLVAIAPFRYVQIIWTILAGLVFWGEVPETMVLVGIAVICVSGVYIASYEASAKK